MELEGKYTVTRSYEISNESGCKNMSAGANTGHMDRNTKKKIDAAFRLKALKKKLGFRFEI
jgi:hypothetical protein